MLEAVVGQGGMGKVFKALDKMKEEAQDKNPYIAVKVLNEDFKRHPKSLQALQRESRKSQDLAHPNIVTVFDFDRDRDNVFMTMEFLEGESLDKFNKRHSLRGIEHERAMEIIQALAAGLTYAHKKGVVHSDFKPANAFLTKNGVVKIFDFGIARAATQSTDLEGEKTLFDAGELGALTPAYASCEMIEGGDPDPRDDIYALAVVAYELFAGKHPYDKKSAVKARDSGMTPDPIKGLPGNQWRAILHGLAFDREKRTPSVEDFVTELSPRRLPVGLLAMGSVLVALVIGALFLLVPQYLDQRQLEELIAIIEQGNDNQVTAMLPDLDELRAEKPDSFGDVFDTEATRRPFIEYFNRRIRAVWDPTAGLFDYPQATLLLTQVSGYLPDSRQLGEMERRVADERDTQIAELYNELNTLLAEGLLIAEQAERNAMVVVATISRIDPDDSRVNSDEIPSRFAQVAGETLRTGDLTLAEAIADQALALAPGDTALREIKDRAANERQRVANESRISELEALLASGLPVGAVLVPEVIVQEVTRRRVVVRCRIGSIGVGAADVVFLSPTAALGWRLDQDRSVRIAVAAALETPVNKPDAIVGRVAGGAVAAPSASMIAG